MFNIKGAKIFFDDLVYRGKRIDWVNSINHYIYFEYFELKGHFLIVEYDKDSHILDLLYNNQIFKITTQHLKAKEIGSILGVYTQQYRYQINEIINNKYSSIKIIKQTRMKYKNEKMVKSYTFLCLNCNNTHNISESNLNQGNGCPYCACRKLMRGVNDMWTTNPELAKLLADPEDGYKYMKNSGKKLHWKCPECGNIIKNKSPNNVSKKGVACPKCSDGISYPEKFMLNLFSQLHIAFIHQFGKTSLPWCKNYKYDFYLPNLNCIIETHGKQHYEKCGLSRFRSLKEEQENDKNKKDLALQNGIEHYIVIDCRESELEFIKNNILNSKLNSLLNLLKVDWLEIDKQSQRSLVKRACDLWNSGIHNIKDISNTLNISIGLAYTYLKKGKKYNWCNYKRNLIVNVRSNAKKVYCITTDEIFLSITLASNKYGKQIQHIGECCKHKRKYAGKLPDGTKLVWVYYDEYVGQQKTA